MQQLSSSLQNLPLSPTEVLEQLQQASQQLTAQDPAAGNGSLQGSGAIQQTTGPDVTQGEKPARPSSESNSEYDFVHVSDEEFTLPRFLTQNAFKTGSSTQEAQHEAVSPPSTSSTAARTVARPMPKAEEIQENVDLAAYQEMQDKQSTEGCSRGKACCCTAESGSTEAESPSQKSHTHQACLCSGW